MPQKIGSTAKTQDRTARHGVNWTPAMHYYDTKRPLWTCEIRKTTRFRPTTTNMEDVTCKRCLQIYRNREAMKKRGPQ